MKLKTQKQPNGEWTALDEDTYDYDSYVGWGKTEQEAIDDLVETAFEGIVSGMKPNGH